MYFFSGHQFPSTVPQTEQLPSGLCMDFFFSASDYKRTKGRMWLEEDPGRWNSLYKIIWNEDVLKILTERTQGKRNPPGYGFPELGIGAMKKKGYKSVTAFIVYYKIGVLQCLGGWRAFILVYAADQSWFQQQITSDWFVPMWPQLQTGKNSEELSR